MLARSAISCATQVSRAPCFTADVGIIETVIFSVQRERASKAFGPIGAAMIEPGNIRYKNRLPNGICPTSS